MRREARSLLVGLVLSILVSILCCQQSRASDGGIRKAMSSYVPIYAVRGDEFTCGAGVYVGDNIILSVRHIVLPDHRFYLDKQYTKELVVLRLDNENDLALFTSPVKGKAVKFGVVRLYEEVVIVGTPLCNEGIPFFGRVVKLNPIGSQLMVDSKPMGGFSGGGIFKLNGQLIGVTNISWGDNNSHVNIGVTLGVIRSLIRRSP